MKNVWLGLAASGVLSLLPAVAAANPQQSPGPAIQPAFAGDCAVVATIDGLGPSDRIQIELDGAMLPARSAASAVKSRLEFPTTEPLQAGETLRLRVNRLAVGAVTTVGGNEARPAGSKAPGTCDAEPEEAFKGTSFYASGYIGWAFDQFAPAELSGYPPGTATSKTNRSLFGVDFEYRALGDDDSKYRLWLTGETLHGVRTADIDCTAEVNKPAVCTPQPNLTYARAVLAEASSLEAYAAPRLEFLRVQKNASTAAQMYVTTRLGFIALADAPRVYQNFHVGVGLVADNSIFEGSTLEVGWGNNELLSGKKWKRLKIDGLLSISLDQIPFIGDKGSFFIQIYIDNDLRGKGADSVQTFLGFDFDLRKLAGG